MKHGHVFRRSLDRLRRRLARRPSSRRAFVGCITLNAPSLYAPSPEALDDQADAEPIAASPSSVVHVAAPRHVSRVPQAAPLPDEQPARRTFNPSSTPRTWAEMDRR